MRFLSLLIFLAVSLPGFSQYDEYEWGDDIVTAKGKYNVMRTECKSGNFEVARGPLLWLLKETPNLHENLYIYGARVYEGLEKTTEDADKKAEIQDSVLWVYDARIKYFGNEANVLNYKGKVAWKYKMNREGSHKELYSLYKKIHALNGDTLFPINATALMYLSCTEYRKKGISRDELKTLYFLLMSAMEKQVNEGRGSATWVSKNADRIEKKFISTAKLNCEEVEQIIGEKFKINPDLPTAKRLKSMLTQLKCNGSPLLLESITYIERYEPSAGGAMTVASIYLGQKNLDSALVYFQRAEKLSTTPSQQSNICYEIAKIYEQKLNRPKAREYAQKSANTGYNKARAYTFIGNLYFNSFTICKGSNVLEERAVFLAAYDMFEKAGNNKGMQLAKEQFPSGEDIFTYSKKEGDEIEVGCWIKVKTTLRKR